MTALREEVPSCATRPDRMVGIPTLIVLACARATQGAANVAAPAPISARVERRLMPGVRVLVIVTSLLGRVPKILWKSLGGDRPVSMPTRFQSEGGDVKPKMNYESEFILGKRTACLRFGRRMINLSSFIAFHARRTPDRCALKYRGE